MTGLSTNVQSVKPMPQQQVFTSPEVAVVAIFTPMAKLNKSNHHIALKRTFEFESNSNRNDEESPSYGSKRQCIFVSTTTTTPFDSPMTNLAGANSSSNFNLPYFWIPNSNSMTFRGTTPFCKNNDNNDEVIELDIRSINGEGHE